MYERSSGFVGPHRSMHCHLQIILQSITCRCACITFLAITSVGIFSAKVSAATPNRGQGISDTVEEEFRQRNGSLFTDWPTPQAVLVITGELDGYIEPCGCTGKENQKGGLSRRQNFLTALKSEGWPVVAVDLGGLVKRFGRQAEVKYQSIADGLRQMGYSGIGFGPADLRLPAEELVAAVAPVGNEPTPFLSANVGLLGLDANITPRFRVVEIGGLRIGITSVLGNSKSGDIRNAAIEVTAAEAALQEVVKLMQPGLCDHYVLLSWGNPEEARSLAKSFPQFDIVVTAGGADEPPSKLPVLENGARLVELGHKGMFAVTIGFFDNKDDPLKSQRVPLDARWGEAEDMIDLLATYQRQLESLGLTGLGLSPVRHQTGRRFAGSDACGDCHTYAYEVWENSSHSYALTTLEDQEPRRDGDPECLSCHVVGWAPQRFEPFEGGFLSMQKTPHLAHNGCENCHGPAAAHAAVERGDVRASLTERDRLREELAMSIDTPESKQKVISNCLECHDLDNSPEFDFEDYWPSVDHTEEVTDKNE